MQDDGTTSNKEGSSGDGDFPSLVIKPVRGRLGNHIWGYMQALGLELNYQVEPVISLESFNYLEPYFKNIRLRVAERDVCGYDEYYKAFLKYLDERVIEVGGNRTRVTILKSSEETNQYGLKFE